MYKEYERTIAIGSAMHDLSFESLAFGRDTSSGNVTVSHDAKDERTWTMNPLLRSPVKSFLARTGEVADQPRNRKKIIRPLVIVGGIFQLARLGTIPPIRPQDIKESSKADIIAKMLVLAQTTGFGL